MSKKNTTTTTETTTKRTARAPRVTVPEIMPKTVAPAPGRRGRKESGNTVALRQLGIGEHFAVKTHEAQNIRRVAKLEGIKVHIYTPADKSAIPNMDMIVQRVK
jgi:hypothetical protein